LKIARELAGIASGDFSSPPQTEPFATALENIANVYLAQCKHYKALEKLYKSMKIKRILYGENSIEIASNIEGIAKAYAGLGNKFSF
jgi:ribosome-binding ATPase YchF (GTP1/OBG family)